MPVASRRPLDTDDYLVDGVADTEDELLEDDDEDVRAARSSAIQSGWDAALKSAQTDRKAYTNEFRFSEDPQLVKFLTNEPFAVFRQHWLERAGKKSFVCLEQECPLCEILGDTPRAKAAFSIVNLSSESPVVEILLTSPTLTNQLAKFDTDAKTGPLDRLYWSMSRTGKGPKTTYSILPVKARDLAEDWGIDQSEVEDQIEGFEPLTPRVISSTPRDEMVSIAREMSTR